MSDNTTLNPGTGGDTIATEDIATANQQNGGQGLPTTEYKIARGKIAVGGVDTDLGDANDAMPLDVRDTRLIAAVETLTEEVRLLRTLVIRHL